MLGRDGAYCDNGVPYTSDIMKLCDVSEAKTMVLEIDELLQTVHCATELIAYCIRGARGQAAVIATRCDLGVFMV